MSTITSENVARQSSKEQSPDVPTVALCCYHNPSHQLQVARISNVPNWYFERVVFPQQQLLFEAPPEAQLEIYTGGMASAVLADRIACDRLKVDAFSSSRTLVA